MKAIRYIVITIIISGIFIIGGYYLLNRITTAITTNTDSYIYDLPFAKGTEHKIIQGYGGLFSHKNTAALDFSMPVGTPIYAAREGRIYSYKEDSNEGGITEADKRKVNYIIILHDDGSYGCYWHLQKNGVVIKNGKVNKGQLIGYSGKTGFALQPHLHFSVKRKLNYDKDSFVQTKFNTSQGVVILQSGQSYKKP